MNSELKKAAKNDFEKYLLKLNIRKHRDIKLVTRNKKKAVNWFQNQIIMLLT